MNSQASLATTKLKGQRSKVKARKLIAGKLKARKLIAGRPGSQIQTLIDH